MNALRTALVLLALIGAVGLARADAEEASGYGSDEQAAWDNALKEAQRLARNLLPAEFRAERWGLDAPAFSPDLLRDTNALVSQGKASRDGPLDPDSGKKLWVARYTVRLTPEYLERVRELARAEEAARRQWLVGKLLAGFVVVLLVVSAYLRLEEWSRGYATRLLRLAAAVVLALAVLALWLMG